MNIWSNAIITTKGLALQAKLTSGTPLQITKAQSGAGTVSESALASQTAVTTPKQTLNFRTVSYPTAGTATLPVYLLNDGLSTGYTVTQVGIFAQDPDDGEILYMIAQAASGTGTDVPSATEMPGFTAEWAFSFTYGQASSVNVTISAANTVSVGEAQTLISDAITENNDGYLATALEGKANVSHVHSAADITSGILPVARGGTGNSSVDTAPTAGSTKMATSGGIYTALTTKAAAFHDHSASDITSGVLPVMYGGTGNRTADTTPTAGSTKMVTSGGVAAALSETSEAISTLYTAVQRRQTKITSGTAAPTGGSDGDVYIQY